MVAAGPAASLALALAFTLLANLLRESAPVPAFVSFAVAQLNFVLLALNLMPVHPLDGGRLLALRAPGLGRQRPSAGPALLAGRLYSGTCRQLAGRLAGHRSGARARTRAAGPGCLQLGQLMSPPAGVTGWSAASRRGGPTGARAATSAGHDRVEVAARPDHGAENEDREQECQDATAMPPPGEARFVAIEA